MSRIVVATDGPCPGAALRRAATIAGEDGEVVLAAVVVVPHAMPLEAAPEGAVAAACAMLDRGERALEGCRADTRLVRARSFAEGVLGLLADEHCDALLLQVGTGLRNGARAEVEAILQKAAPEVLLVRPAVSP
ncbi:MAG: hypothetical protein AB7V62_02060 [Thermoleophilia bacterium]